MSADGPEERTFEDEEAADLAWREASLAEDSAEDLRLALIDIMTPVRLCMAQPHWAPEPGESSCFACGEAL